MSSSSSADQLQISIVMPCLNEVSTLEECIINARQFLARSGLRGEIIIADNGSTDGSQALAANLGVKVLAVAKRGYGSALQSGIQQAAGQYIVIGDSDASYDFSTLEPFIEKLREGADLVIGNRFRGGIAPRAMPLLHRYFGNPLLTLLANLLFRVPCGDIYCGLRALTRQTFERLKLESDGMEYALEMMIKCQEMNLKIAEVSTTLSRDGRNRPSHLNTWCDGMRSLQLYWRLLNTSKDYSQTGNLKE